MAPRLASVPDWYRNRDYSYTKNAGPGIWFMALFYRIIFDAIPESREFFVSGEDRHYKKFWDRYESKEARWDDYLACTGDPSERISGQKASPTIKEILTAGEAISDVADPSKAVISVALEATEGTIIEQFKLWLEKRKREYPAPLVKRRGRSIIETRKFQDDNYESWADQRILQLADLLFWRKCFKKDVSNATLESPIGDP